MSQLQRDGDFILAGAGASLTSVAQYAAACSLTGLEFAVGIPGSIGGAVFMNAGAYDGEMSRVVDGVTAVCPDGVIREFSANEIRFGYRHSVFQENHCVICEVRLRLQPGDASQIEATMADLTHKRESKQPLEWPSAGSTFKRPQGAFAGKLIEDCGLRGFTVGGAQISEKHCGFVINRGGATCADVVALTEQVRQIVEARTGFVLEREIRVVK